MELMNAEWMKIHLHLVCNLNIVVIIIGVCILISTGNSGDTFPGLSEGEHTFDVRFTAAGSSRMTTARFEFIIGNDYSYFVYA